jgi:hypothetical protein
MMKKLCLGSLLVLAVLLVSPPFVPPVAAKPPHRPEVRTYRQFDLKIPGVTETMLEPSFWVDRILEPDRVLMSPAEIGRYNRQSVRSCPVLHDLRTFRLAFSGTQVREMIGKVSARPSKPRYMNNEVLPDSYFDALEKALAVEQIPERVDVRFGITVKRTEMRAFPTHDRIFSEPDDYEFDRFIETAVYPIEPVAILHTSADGAWYFAQMYNYLAWIPVEAIALTDRQTLFAYLDTPDFLVVSGKGIFTGFNPFRPEISELQLEMGVRIPLTRPADIPPEIDGQNPAGNFVVTLPTRGPENRLEWRLGLISRADDVQVGYLPLTQRNIITQAFKFLGQRYGWGGMFNTRDCSAFIMDTFRSMGVLLPRNSGEQGKQALAVRHEMPDGMSLEDRKKVFDQLPPATPIYMSGHAMLYLCRENDDYYIIHDFAGYTAPNERGELERSKMRGVLVTPLLGTYLSSGKRYMEGLYAACEFRLP